MPIGNSVWLPVAPTFSITTNTRSSNVRVIAECRNIHILHPIKWKHYYKQIPVIRHYARDVLRAQMTYLLFYDKYEWCRRWNRGSRVFHEEFRASFGRRIGAGICMKYSMKLYRRLIEATWWNFGCKNIAINFKINLTYHYAKFLKIGKKLYV